MEAEIVRPIVKITSKPLATLIITNVICSKQTKHANPQIYHHSVQEKVCIRVYEATGEEVQYLNYSDLCKFRKADCCRHGYNKHY